MSETATDEMISPESDLIDRPEIEDAEFAAVSEGDGVILRDDQTHLFSRKLEVLSNPTGIQSAAMGALRNHLTQQHLGVGRRALAICSVGDDVNRPLISTSLAIAAAQAGVSTVLVDANLRNPEISSLLMSRDDHYGLSDYLVGDVVEGSQIVRGEVLPNLSVVHAGTPPPNPQLLLSGQRFDEFATSLMRTYALTIVDCPPARHSSDVRRLASVLRYALVVVKRDVSYISDVKRLIDDLTADRVTVVGTFMNVA